jgi:hypothetical protein
MRSKTLLHSYDAEFTRKDSVGCRHGRGFEAGQVVRGFSMPRNLPGVRGKRMGIMLLRGDPASRQLDRGHNAIRDPSGTRERAQHVSIPARSLDAH